MPGKKRAQNPLVSAKIGTICTYAALPDGSGTVSAHLRRQHKSNVVQCKLEVGMGRAVGKTDCESARGPDATATCSAKYSRGPFTSTRKVIVRAPDSVELPTGAILQPIATT